MVDCGHAKTKPTNSRATFMPGADRVGCIDVENYLTEDLVQMLCAIKSQLELYQMHGLNLSSNIADVQAAICKVQSVAQGIRFRNTNALPL
jgi:hypothetical protein